MQMRSSHQRKQICDTEAPLYMVAIEKKINTAHRCRDRGQQVRIFNEALSELESKIDPKNKTLHDLLAFAELNWEITEPQKAISFLKEAIQVAPKDSRSFLLLGKYLLNKGMKAQALTFLDRAIQLDPSDKQTPKLRERAARQQKRNYTVVGNLDLAESKTGVSESTSAQKKSEATRLFNINDLQGAAKALEQAEQSDAQNLDKALAALMGHRHELASSEQLSKKIKLRQNSISLFALFSTIFIVALAIIGGVFISSYFSDRRDLQNLVSIETRLKEHQLSTLLTSLDELSAEDTERQHLQLLANVLLFTFHGHNKDFLVEAEYLFDELSEKEKNKPEVWYAQQLLLRDYSRNKDVREKSELLKDKSRKDEEPQNIQMSKLKKAAYELEKKISDINFLAEKSYYILMTLAEAANQKSLNEKSKIILHRIISLEKLKGTPIMALHSLANLYAFEGDYKNAYILISQIAAVYPKHTLSRVNLLILAYLMDPPRIEKIELDEKVASKKGTEKIESVFENQLKIATKLNTDPEVAAIDLVPLKISLAVFAQMKTEYKRFSNLLHQSIGNKEESPTLHNPELLEMISGLYILDFSVQKAISLLENEEVKDQLEFQVPLLKNLTRAKVLNGIRLDSPSNFRQLITASRKPKALSNSLLLRTGQLNFDFNKSPLPFKLIFSSHYFPELEIADVISSGAAIREIRQKFERISTLKLAQMALELNQNEAAMKYLDEIRWSAEDNPQFLLTDALLMIHQNKKADAKSTIERAVNFAPDNPRILLTAAKIQLDTGNLRSALLYIQKIQTEKYTSPDIDALYAQILMKQGLFKQAVEKLEMNLKKSPQSEVLLSPYILLQCQLNKTKKAMDSAKILAENMPEDLGSFLVTAPITSTFVLYQKYKRGSLKINMKNQLLDILDKNPQQASVHYVLGLMEDDLDAKKKYFKTAISMRDCASSAARIELKNPGQSLLETQPKRKKSKRRRKR